MVRGRSEAQTPAEESFCWIGSVPDFERLEILDGCESGNQDSVIAYESFKFYKRAVIASRWCAIAALFINF